MRLEIGRVHRAHGLRGEVAVSLSSDRDGRLAPGAVVWTGDDRRTIVASRPHQDRWIVHFEGLGDRDAADALRGLVLTAEPVDDTDGDETLWVHELIGAEVVLPDGTAVGRVGEVHDNPAHDLLVLDTGALVPVVFVTDASGRPERIVIDPPEGLLALAEPDAAPQPQPQPQPESGSGSGADAGR